MKGFKKYFLLTLLCSLFSFLIFVPVISHAATISLTPANGNFAVGQSFAVNIIVSTPDQAMNAVSGVLAFPSDLLEVSSLSKGGSIIGLWVQEPAFSNNTGQVNFEGIALNPGFTGGAGRVLSVNFKVKRAGTAKLTFLTPAILANDGQGTNILQSSGQANLTLGQAVQPQVVPQAEDNSLVISSPTHPDPNKWYRSNAAKFVWDLPSDASGVRLLISQSANATPNVLYEDRIEEKEISDLADGVWYFHAQYRTADDGWSAISHFRFQIDTTSPESFKLRAEARDDETDPRVKLKFESSDETSGIDYYEIKLDGQALPLWRGKASELYELPVLSPGTRAISARVFDRAGNSLAAKLEVKVAALLAPTWLEYPNTLANGEVLVAKGRTYPNTGVLVTLSGADLPAELVSVKSDETGNFTFIFSDKLNYGTYELSAKVLNDNGASSLPSEIIKISVRAPAWWRLGAQAVTLLSIIVPLFGLVIVLGFLLYQSYHRFRKLRRRLRAEVHEAEESIGKAFDLLREDLEKQLTILERAKTKRDLTREEARILTRVRKNLRVAEKFIKKEIGDIEKEVK